MASTNSQNRRVFVGNIPYGSTEEQLLQICQEVGPVVSFRLVIDKDTGKPKGYGFCEYKDEETAASARRNLQGYELNGRQLRVNFAENDHKAGQGLGGGPGLLPVDPHQPIGISSASTAASVMAGALGGNGAMSQQNGLCNDQLTHYLATMSRNQMFEVMSELKVMATQDRESARQLLLSNPQLSKALFQAEIMLGMVTPQHNFQPSSSAPMLRPSVVNQQPYSSAYRPAGPILSPPPEGMQYPEKQAVHQASAADESALLEQLMKLTPEQLSSLTFEQQQQVIQIQTQFRRI